MSNYSRYFALEKAIKEKGVYTDRKELLHTYTEGTISSLRGLKEPQYNSFCDWIEEAYQIGKHNSSSDKMRKKIIVLFKKMDYTLESGKADMKAIYSWVLKYGYLKKPLNQYAYEELPKLVSQAESVYKSHVENL